MGENGEPVEKAAPKRNLQWIGASIFLLGLGSMGPMNVYYAVTDPHYFDKFSGWRILMLPFGTWLLTGFLFQGLAVLWVGGIRRDPDWAKHTEAVWEGWLKVGLWLLGIIIALVLTAFFFGGVASLLSTLDKGTLLISFLLLMILFALWRIGNQMKRH